LPWDGDREWDGDEKPSPFDWAAWAFETAIEQAESGDERGAATTLKIYAMLRRIHEETASKGGRPRDKLAAEATRHYLDCRSRRDKRTLKVILKNDGFSAVEPETVRQQIKRMRDKP